jgi:gentisate 1,2-dioxygenase
MNETTVQADSKPLSPYAAWQKSEGVPIISGLIVDDIHGELPLQIWPRKGVKGAFINLKGGEGSMDAHVIEIPPTGQTEPEHYMFEEIVIVLSGRGATSIWLEGGAKQTFEWQKGSVFSPPINSWRQHFNGTPGEPVRLLVISNAPVVFNLYRSREFIFNCRHAFTDRFAGEEDFFSGKGKSVSATIWRTNFVSDIYSFTLRDYSHRGAGGSGVWLDMAENTIQSHIAQFPTSTYKTAHRHGPGAHVLMLTGKGFSLMWDEGKPMQKIDWGPGALFVPPDMWWHQHFNTGSEPARYLAVHYGFWRVVAENLGTNNGRIAKEHEIQYAEEDPVVLKTFLAELERNGAPTKPLHEWRK